MEEEKKEKNPLMFLEEDEMKKPEKQKITNEAIELNDLKILENDYFLIGIYGNGSAYLKASFFIEMKNSFKIKFVYKKSDSNKKILSAELYSFTLNNNINILLLITKTDMVKSNTQFILDYLKNKNVTYKNMIVFDCIKSKNFYSKIKENNCYYLKSSKFEQNLTSNSLILPLPNSIDSFSASFLTYCEFYDLPCLVLISVFNEYDLGLDSIKSFESGVNKLEFLTGKIDKEYFKKNGIEEQMIRSVFNEFNNVKKSYFS